MLQDLADGIQFSNVERVRETAGDRKAHVREGGALVEADVLEGDNDLQQRAERRRRGMNDDSRSPNDSRSPSPEGRRRRGSRVDDNSRSPSPSGSRAERRRRAVARASPWKNCSVTGVAMSQ